MVFMISSDLYHKNIYHWASGGLVSSYFTVSHLVDSTPAGHTFDHCKVDYLSFYVSSISKGQHSVTFQASFEPSVFFFSNNLIRSCLMFMYLRRSFSYTFCLGLFLLSFLPLFLAFFILMGATLLLGILGSFSFLAGSAVNLTWLTKSGLSKGKLIAQF